MNEHIKNYPIRVEHLDIVVVFLHDLLTVRQLLMKIWTIEVQAGLEARRGQEVGNENREMGRESRQRISLVDVKD
jgi:hypothetical protein